MAKKKATTNRLNGVAGIKIIEDDDTGVRNNETNETRVEEANHHESNGKAAKPERKAKAKPEPQSDVNFGVSEIRKSAAFANSVGGLDKAIALLQILKVAKEVQ